MFILRKPIYKSGQDVPLAWKDVDQDEDYGDLLRRNLIAGQTVGAVNFGNELTFLVFVNGTVLKVDYEVPLDSPKDQS